MKCIFLSDGLEFVFNCCGSSDGGEWGEQAAFFSMSTENFNMNKRLGFHLWM